MTLVIRAPGRGLPVGGTTGQIPVKLSSADFDIGWADAPEGTGGSVLDVAGRTGHVVLGENDVTGLAAHLTTIFADLAGLGTASTHAASDFDTSGAAATAQTAAQDYTDDAISTEVTDRSAAIATEVTNRNTAIGVEVSDREAAITTEATARASAITTEATARATAVTGEASARATADALLIPLTQRGTASGVATLDSGGLIPDAQIPSGIARDSEVTSAISTAINALVASAPGTLDTLKELADALGDDPNFAASVTTSLAGKVPTTLTLSAGNGLSGGGDLSANRAFAIDTSIVVDKTTAQTLLNKTLTAPVLNSPTGLAAADIPALPATKITSGQLIVAQGGTGASTLTAHGLLIGAGTSAVAVSAAGTAAQLLQSGGASADPGWISLSGDATIASGGVVTLVGSTNVENIIRANTLNQMGTPTGNLSIGGFRITSLADGSLSTDAATLGQIAAGYQPLALNLTTIAGLTATTNNFLVSVASAWASRTPSQVKTTLSLDQVTNTSDATKQTSNDARYQPLAANLTALAQGAGWLLDANAWTVHVVPTQSGMTTVVAANTIGHAGLTYTNGDAVIVTGLSATTGPFNGSMYYIVGQTSTTVQLAIAPGGSAIVFAGTADTATVTLTGVNQFTVAVDATGYLGPGVKASYNDGGVDYGVMHSVKNNAGTTTVTLIPNNDYSIANATLTAPRFSYSDTPVGFPASFACAMLLTGTADPSIRTYRWRTIGRQLTLMCFHFNTGTSSSTTHSLSLPAPAGTASAAFNSFLATTDSGTAGLGYATVSSSSNAATLNGKSTGGNTASGGSGINGQIVYEF